MVCGSVKDRRDPFCVEKRLEGNMVRLAVSERCGALTCGRSAEDILIPLGLIELAIGGIEPANIFEHAMEEGGRPSTVACNEGARYISESHPSQHRGAYTRWGESGC
jgi:hypothetical protein